MISPRVGNDRDLATHVNDGVRLTRLRKCGQVPDGMPEGCYIIQ